LSVFFRDVTVEKRVMEELHRSEQRFRVLVENSRNLIAQFNEHQQLTYINPAGAFILVLRPFKVGDFVEAGEVTGTVRAIGLFTTAIDTPDNVQTYVGNAKVMGGTIRNYTTNPTRRVDLTAQLDHTVDPRDAIRRLKEALPAIANVAKDPAPQVEILGFNERGTQLAVRPFTHNDHYWQVYFDTNLAIRETMGAAGYPVPEEYTRERRA